MLRNKNDLLAGSLTQQDFQRRLRSRNSNHRKFLKRFISIKGFHEEMEILEDGDDI